MPEQRAPKLVYLRRPEDDFSKMNMNINYKGITYKDITYRDITYKNMKNVLYKNISRNNSKATSSQPIRHLCPNCKLYRTEYRRKKN